MKLLIAIPFLIVFVLFIISLRNKIFAEISLSAKFGLLLCALVPIWGVVLAIFGIIYLIRDIKNAGKHNRIFSNTAINRYLFGEDKCIK